MLSWRVMLTMEQRPVLPRHGVFAFLAAFCVGMISDTSKGPHDHGRVITVAALVDIFSHLFSLLCSVSTCR